MLVCNVSLRPPRTAISADVAEAATAVDGTTTGNIVFATLVDDPANVGDRVDAYLGEIMVEAATAAATVTAGLTYVAAIAEAVTAADSATGDVPVIITASVDETAAAASAADAVIDSDRWSLVGSWTYSTPVANVDFTGLAGYSEIRVLIRQVTSSAIGFRYARVSTDNGSTFLSASGDYRDVLVDGIESNTTLIIMHQTALATARTAEIIIAGWNLTANKLVQARTRTDERQWIIPTSSTLNALRIADSVGNLTGGSIYVFAR